jgi:hypothetical protein
MLALTDDVVMRVENAVHRVERMEMSDLKDATSVS